MSGHLSLIAAGCILTTATRMGAMARASMRTLLLSILLAFAAPAWAQQGALTVPRNLQQLTERAAHIVRGNVVGARMERHPELGLPVLAVTLRVRETLKGPAQQTFTFRQYVWDVRDRMDAASYRKGDDVLLFMIAPSRYGLSSPAGMVQGRFRITRDGLGREQAVNGHGNAGLFEGMETQVAKDGVILSPASARLLQRPPRGPLEARELMGLVRDLAAGGR
jgi:hypothetical protein